MEKNKREEIQIVTIIVIKVKFFNLKKSLAYQLLSELILNMFHHFQHDFGSPKTDSTQRNPRSVKKGD